MIGIINYGLGNINAFLNIFKKALVPVKILTSKDDFYDIDKLILPGVGAFDHAMSLFNQSGMRAMVDKHVLEDNIPVLGVCVGLQMMAKSSEEGKLEGLGWINASVKKFDVSKIPYTTRLPHMGWNDVKIVQQNILFRDFPQTANFYFLHSYYVECNELNDQIATSGYGIDFSCAINHKNIYGVQFHPEKSHQSGINLLINYSRI